SASKGSDGILNKATWVHGASCKLSSCLSFDPQYGDNYVNVPHNVATPLNLSHFTLSAWIKVAEKTQYSRIIINKRPYPVGDYATNFALAISPSMNMMAYFGDGSDLYRVRGNASLLTDHWYYVVATFDGSSLSTFVGGHLDGKVAAAGVP